MARRPVHRVADPWRGGALKPTSDLRRPRGGRRKRGFGILESRLQATGGSPGVYIARGKTSRAAGPFSSRYHRFTAFEEFPNEAPRSPLEGFFAAELDFPEAGRWTIAAIADMEGKQAVGTARFRSWTPGVGSCGHRSHCLQDAGSQERRGTAADLHA